MHAFRSRAIALLLPLVLLLGLGMGAATPAPAHAETPSMPAPTGVSSLAVPAAAGTVADAGATGTLVARLAATDAARFNQAALSWAAGGSSTLVAQVRVRTAGSWGDWLTLQVEPSERGRVGSELAYVGDSDAVEARVLATDGTTASDVKLTLIDSNAIPSVSGPEPVIGGNATALNATRSDQVVTDVPQPSIVTREQWGANPAYWNVSKDPECAAPIANFQGAVVHHTAGTNTYTAAEAPGIVRGIYYYHAVQLDWCDIGYNFLVDKYGTIYQGRVGDMQQAIWGAHATYVNGRSLGVSYLGETSSVAPTYAGVKAISDVIAWRFGRYDRLPSDTATYYSGSNIDQQPAITGHGYLKYHSTSCPGTGLSAQMDNIRAMVASRLTRYTLTFDKLPDLLPADRTVTLSGRVTAGLGGNVGFDITGPDGTVITNAASAVPDASGYYATRWTMPAGWSGTASITAHLTVAGAGTMYADQAVSSAARLVINQPSNVAVSGLIDLGGWVEPAAPGVTLTLWGADAGGYTENLGTVTTDAQGNWERTTAFGSDTTQQLTFWVTGTVVGQSLASNKVTVARTVTTASLSIVQEPAWVSDDMLLHGSTVPASPNTTVSVYGRDASGTTTFLGTDTTDAAGDWAMWTSFQNNTTTAFDVWATATVAGTFQTSQTLKAAYGIRKLILDSPNAVPLGDVLTLTGRMYLPGGGKTADLYGRLPGGTAVNLGSVTTDSNGVFRLPVSFGATTLDPVEFWATSPVAAESNHLQVVRNGADATSLSASLFKGLAPTRIVDSRIGQGVAGPIPAGGSVNVAVVGSGVPSYASAVVLNVTVTDPGAVGYLTAFPRGRQKPTVSNLNFSAGQTVANQVIVPVGDYGAITLYLGSQASANVVIDVAGWFNPQGGRPAGGFVPLPSPARLVDSRVYQGRTAALAPGETATIAVTGQLGMPTSGIAAVAVNLTSVEPTADGYLTLSPHGSTRPNSSNLNLVPGTNVPNAAIVKVGQDGSIDLYNGSTGRTHVVVDVVGYYVAGAASASGAYVPLDPARIMDTRVDQGVAGPLAPNASKTLAVVGKGGIGANAGSVVLNATVTDPVTVGWFSLSPAGAPVPTASNLNFAPGQTIANLTTTAVGTGGALTVTNGSLGSSNAIADVAGYYLR